MKRVFNSTIALILCVCMILSGAVMAFAADSVAAPTNVTVASNGDSVTISWIGVNGVKGYFVYRSSSPTGSWEELDKTTSTSYTDTGATAGSTAYYAVRAYKLEKNMLNMDKLDLEKNRIYSDYAVSSQIVTGPAQVKNLKTTNVAARTISLAWDSANGAKGYQVYMLDPNTNKYKRIATTSKKTYVVKNLSAKTTYKFQVRGYNKLNGVIYGAFSNELTVTTTLADVENFRLSESGMYKYTLSWDANEHVKGFQLMKYDDYDDEWKIIRFDGNAYTTATSYTVSGLTEASHDKYRIRTYIDSNNYGTWSETVYGGTLPKAPSNLKVAANTDNGVTLMWTGVTGSAGYEIYCKDYTGNWKSVGTTDRSTFNHSNLTESKKYEYKVRAYVGTASQPIYGNFGESVSITYEPLVVPDEPYNDAWQATGILGYLYDPSEKCFYTADDTWQRNFGYSEIYDNAASLVIIIIETNRLKFEYDNRDWMFQLWKGQYGWVLYGAEIGIYTKDKNKPVDHYDCATDEDMIQMSMELWEKSNGVWVRTFGRPYERQWWHTGFVVGNMIGRNKDLQMRARLTMRDFEMLDAVVGAFKASGFTEIKGTVDELLNYFSKDGRQSYKDAFFVKGLDIYFYWTENFQ